MSVEASWDLRSLGNATPRSLCVYASSSDSHNPNPNPFESPDSHAPSHASAVACVYGTERGTLHFRAYPSLHSPTTRSGGLSSAAPSTTTTTSRSHSTPLQAPLGTSQATSRQLPRSYYPVDLKHSFPGSVVGCIKLTKQVFLVLLDDGRGTSPSQPGAFQAQLVTLGTGAFQVVPTHQPLPRMSTAVYSPHHNVLVYAAGRTLATLSPELWGDVKLQQRKSAVSLAFDKTLVPAPGVRSGQDAMTLTHQGHVAIVAVSNSFYAVQAQLDEDVSITMLTGASKLDPSYTTKILSLTQSSQVHPVILLDIQDQSVDADWACILLANGRECAVLDLYYGPPSAPRIAVTKPRHGSVTVASPILAAAASWPFVALLTSDGLVSIRSPSCMAIALRTVEVGNRPNDYFVLRTLPSYIVATSYSGEAKVLKCQADTAQELADRLMRLAIDALGANGFPRAELAEANQASFTATSYVGPEPSNHTRLLLYQYLEAVLGLTDWESGGTSGWPTELSTRDSFHGTFGDLESSYSGRGAPPTVVSSSTPAALLTGSALLCLVCLHLTPPNSSLANRAAKSCAEKMGVVIEGNVSTAAMHVCEMVADKLLREASSAFSLLKSSSSSPTLSARGHRTTQATFYTDFVETAIWLLRACSKHERAIDVAYDKLRRQVPSSDSGGGARGSWSQLKYESYTATHLSELWASGTEAGCKLVLQTSATHRLLENNPRLGLSVFTADHPQNEAQWRSTPAKDDPLAHGDRVKPVIQLLKSINPSVPYNSDQVISHDDESLPLDSGRSLAACYLESALGIATGRPVDSDVDILSPDEHSEESIVDFHDELSFLLLEGVISERRDDEAGDDSEVGKIYRRKLRRLLRWPLTKIRSDQFMAALPSSFLQEKALVLGRLGRHEDALRILYRDLNSLDLALEYCDDRHESLQSQQDHFRARGAPYHEQGNQTSIQDDNAYLPLLRVALESEDKERGTTAAIQVLALRRSAIDRAAALRLLPSDVPVSAVARPFLIPALVDSESQVRRLKIVSALLRARYLRLKGQLTSAQLKAQANLHVVPQLKSLNLGDPLHSTNPFRARTSAQAGSTMPDVMIVKHFFPRHLVIQAKVTNAAGLGAKNSRTLSDVAFVVAESSDEAIQPLLQVPIQLLPSKMTGCAWCVLSASPSRMEGPTAQLTCELRYTVQSVEASAGLAVPSAGVMGRTYVEELQDLEVHASHFS